MSFIFGMREWVVTAVFAVIIGAFLLMVVWGRVDLMRGSEPEGAARLYPADAVAFGWFSARPRSSEQREMITKVLAIADSHGDLEGGESALEDMILERFGVELRDARDWAGPEFSFGLLHSRGLAIGGSDGIEWVGAAHVRDTALAHERLNAALVDHKGRWEGGYEIWEPAGDGGVWVALSSDVVIAASSADALADMTYGASDARLWDDAQFQQAREAMMQERAGSFYVSLSAADDLLDGVSGEDALMGAGDARELSWAAAAVYLTPDAARVSVISPAGGSPLKPAMVSEADLAGYPADAAFAIAFGFDPDVNRWREYLSGYRLGSDGAAMIGAAGGGEYMDALGAGGMESMSLADGLDGGLAVASLMLGVDIETGLLGHLSGRGSAAIWGWRGAPVVGAVLGHTESGSESLAASVDMIAANLEALGLDIESSDGEWRFGAGELAGGARISGGRLIISSDAGSLEEITAGGGGLLTDAGFRAMADMVGDGRHLFAYGDYGRIEDIFAAESEDARRVGRFAISDGGSDALYERLEIAVEIYPGTAVGELGSNGWR